jgi:ketosteroid isomerase-like protein
MNKNIFLLLIGLLVSPIAFSQSSDEKAVSAAVEKLRTALISADKTQLESIAASELSYGHSSGKIETKTEFVEALVSGKSDFIDITLSEQTIKVVGNTALVRHNLSGNTNDPGKGPGTVKLHILLVWVKQGKDWKLLGRQAVKI